MQERHPFETTHLARARQQALRAEADATRRSHEVACVRPASFQSRASVRSRLAFGLVVVATGAAVAGGKEISSMAEYVVLLHGASGFADELVVAVVAFLALWLATRLGTPGRS